MTPKIYENENKRFANAMAKTFNIDSNRISTIMDPRGWINIELEHEGKKYEIGSVVENSKEICVYINKYEFREAVGKINKESARALADNIRKELGAAPEKQISVKEIETGKDIEWDGWLERNLTKKSLQEKIKDTFRLKA